ncbi:MAG: glycosyltransferase family 4 protein [Planctomycetes bacterium]|nr:glycosyltransferase family 4 protein [Planctomycetota bacterium]
MTSNDNPNLLMLSSYVPRRCGIATFAHDLSSGLAEHVYQHPLGANGPIRIAAVNDRDETYDYGPEVMLRIRQHRREDYRNAADEINTSRAEVLGLQHEFGIYGGPDGAYILDLLDHVRKPVVATLHTILMEPSPGQIEVLKGVSERCASLMVMAEKARTILVDRYGVPTERIRVIPHGVPDVEFCDPEPRKARFGLAGRPVLLTFGLLGPGKGIETMLDALEKVVVDHPNVAYIVLGVTHPAVRRDSGESYRLSLERRAVQLGIQENVIFHNRYASLDDLCDYLLACDVYVTPYRSREQITSGTLAYALASGRAIVSTPYWHAQELLAGGRGRLVDFDDVDGWAKNISELLGDAKLRESIRRSAYDFGRRMIWANVTRTYADTCAEARAEFAERTGGLAATKKPVMRMSLPEVRLDHMLAMTDGTGMFQHAIYATPNRIHGYCTDDNARSLLVSAMTWSLFRDDAAVKPLTDYLSFLHFALPAGGGRFRNFMSYDRRWLDENGSDDCQGRAIWALGYLVSHAPNEALRDLAMHMFRTARPIVDTMTWPRGLALGILGIHYYLRAVPEDDDARSALSRLADGLETSLSRHATKDWPWIEDVVTYDNGRIPQALIIAGFTLDREPLVQRGIATLTWLLDRQRADEGHLSLIGNMGWDRRTGERARFDQQPLEPAALIGACKAAFRASGDVHWLNEMRRCFEWYLGQNDAGVSMIDFKTRGCYDGLTESGVNENQGAEAVLSWLMSLLIMHEMQTGDAPDVG